MIMLKQFATKNPILFGLLITLVFLVLVLIALLLGQSLPGDYGREGGQAAGRVIGFLIFLTLLNRLKWKQAAGLSWPKNFYPWLIILVPFVYAVIVYTLAFTGTMSMNFQDPLLSSLVIVNTISVGLLEEITFRGVILYCFLRLWGDKKSGILKSVVASSLMFGLVHAVNFLSGAEMLRVLPQIVYAVLGAIAFGAFVVCGWSIWPAVVFHGLVNAVKELNQMGKSIDITPSSAVILGLAALPLAVYGLLLLRRTSARPIIPETP